MVATQNVVLPPELLCMIFVQLDAKKDIYHAAATCTAWTEPALDHLWRSLSSLRDLLRLLAPLQIQWNRSIPDKQMLLTFGGEPFSLLLDWSRFTKYANRVQTLDLRNTAHLFSYMVWASIGNLRPSLWLLPNLNTVLLGGAYHPDYALLAAVLGPSVSFVDYGIDFSLQRLHHFQLLKYKVPNLAKLRLTTNRFPATDLVKAIEGLQHLESLDAPFQSVSKPLWDLLSQSRYVKEAVLGLLASEEDIIIPPDGFPQLGHLQLTASGREWIVLLASGNCPVTLQKLRVTVKEPVDSLDSQGYSTRSVFEGIAAFSPQVTELSVDLPIEGDYPGVWECVEPLCSCVSLVDLNLSVPCKLDFDGKQFKLFLKAFRNLQKLRIHAPETGMPLSCLDLVARYAPQLVEIGLPFNDTEPLIDVKKPLPPLRNLRHLDMMWTDPRAYSRSIALYLTQRTIQGLQLSGEEDWSEISEYISLLYSHKELLGRLERAREEGFEDAEGGDSEAGE